MQIIRRGYEDVERNVDSLVTMLNQDNWKPDIVVGLTKHGTLPANLVANRLGSLFYSVNWGIHPNIDCNDCALAEEMMETKMKFLIVVGSITTGKTMTSFIDSLDSTVFKKINWYDKVRVAVLNYNIHSGVKVNYKINNITSTDIIEYPWNKS
jgi:hypoxanthine phosphoribosyltransferase